MHVFTPLSWWGFEYDFLNYHVHVISRYTSRKVPYTLRLQALIDVHPPLDFHCTPCISLY